MSTELKKDATIIGVVAVAHGMSHFYHLLLPPLFPAMKEEFGVSYAALGLVLTLYFLASALLQPVAGFVVDRLGGRRVLVAGLATLVAGVALMALGGSYAMLCAGAVIAGAGNSVFHPADYSILNARVSEARLGHAFSTHSIAGALGFAFSPFFSGTLGGIHGWRATVLAGAAIGAVVVFVLLWHAPMLEGRAAEAKKKAHAALAPGILLAAPVVLCFLFFVIYSAGLAGIQGFTVAGLTAQYGVGAAFASAALTAYMLGSASGMLAGGFVVARTVHYERVAAFGLAGSALTFFLVAGGVLPSWALPAAFFVAGASAGITFPARDLIVRAAAPAGAMGRVYGFVYSGLDVGVFATPIFYGWLMDRGMPDGVFYVVAAFTAASTLTVLAVPPRQAAIQRT